MSDLESILAFRWMTETKYWRGNSIVPLNCYCWAIGRRTKQGGREVRMIVWNRSQARKYKWDDEQIWRAMIVTRAN